MMTSPRPTIALASNHMQNLILSFNSQSERDQALFCVNGSTIDGLILHAKAGNDAVKKLPRVLLLWNGTPDAQEVVADGIEEENGHPLELKAREYVRVCMIQKNEMMEQHADR